MSENSGGPMGCSWSRGGAGLWREMAGRQPGSRRRNGGRRGSSRGRVGLRLATRTGTRCEDNECCSMSAANGDGWCGDVGWYSGLVRVGQANGDFSFGLISRGDKVGGDCVGRW
jgi:hypothetical protein